MLIVIEQVLHLMEQTFGLIGLSVTFEGANVAINGTSITFCEQELPFITYFKYNTTERYIITSVLNFPALKRYDI